MSAVCDAGVSWLGKMLAPRSRRAATSTVAMAASAVTVTMGMKATGCEPVKGWSCSVQPRGLAQRNQARLEVESATMRMRKAEPITAAPRRLAWRRLAASSETKAPTARNIVGAATMHVAR